MKHLLLLALATICLFNLTFSQSDSTTVYYIGYQVTTKDSADSYIKFNKQGNLWNGKQYLVKTGVVISEGTYRSAKNTHQVGNFKTYHENGALKSVAIYDDTSRVTERTYYYPSGKKQAWISYVAKGPNDQKCWNEAGVEEPNCVIEKEAKFVGGLQGWRRFLKQNLNTGITAETGSADGQYTVTVQFVVAKDGSLSRIQATDIPAGCRPCATEVIRVLKSGPKWEPAAINGEPVLYQALQKITFVVESEKKKGRRNWG